ncbi:hypothetical protein LWC34_20180 [Kibdelosporangium philippinense]|uniref:GLTT repeat-containing protein n=1 Tax=Kibdelosporangium philippinense TaxID=211113 RepID=A0ABS8ZH12_9PSEU|nr:hypothetical protein [Kibdelosporangium philippinense]MCE7005127.1 hypothetical protein [Kibdelosporangium philippinense]
MRKTIRRGVLVTATAACALGFGFFQASAAPVPTVPGLPLSGLSTLSNVGQGFGEGLAVSPTTPTLPGLPGETRSDLPTDLTGFGELADMLAVQDLTQGLTDLDGVSEFADLPETDGMVPTDLPAADDLGLPAAPPVGLDPSKLPMMPSLPSETNEILDAPVVDVPDTDRLPLQAQLDHNGVAQKLIPNTKGVDVHGVPQPELPNLSSTPDAVKLPATAPQTPGMQSVGLPQQLPVVSSVDTPEVPSIHDVTGDVELPTELPTLPTV